MATVSPGNRAKRMADVRAALRCNLHRRFYLLHVLRRRMDYPSLKRAVQEQAQAFGPTVILIEDKASGTQLIQELVEAGVHAATRFKPEGDKLMRLHAQTGTMENGFVCLPREAH